MSEVHRILVPVDFSECSRAALERAATLAGQLDSEVHVLHIWEAPEFVPPDVPLHESGLTRQSFAGLLEERAEEELAAFVGEARARGIAIQRATAERGRPAPAIVETARLHKYELIVMGTHGNAGFKYALVGSVAEKVVRAAPCPVITVRALPAARGLNIRHILAPVDYSECSRLALDYAVVLARALGAKLDVVHVWDRPAYVPAETVVHGEDGSKKTLVELISDSAEREMKEFLEPHRSGLERGTLEFPAHRLLSGEPASILLAEIEKGEHDLVLVGTHGRTGLAHFLLGSIAERLVRLSPVPVLSVPPAARALRL